jgi:hypothetical protein
MKNPDQYRLDFDPPKPERPIPQTSRKVEATPAETVPLVERTRRKALELIHKQFPSEKIEDLNFTWEETDEKDNLISIVYTLPGTPFRPEVAFRVLFQGEREGEVDKMDPVPKRGII